MRLEKLWRKTRPRDICKNGYSRGLSIISALLSIALLHVRALLIYNVVNNIIRRIQTQHSPQSRWTSSLAFANPWLPANYFVNLGKICHICDITQRESTSFGLKGFSRDELWRIDSNSHCRCWDPWFAKYGCPFFPDTGHHICISS